MKATEIRQKFFEYFQSRNHEIVESAPIVVKDDPTLMFVNAGMNQFKDVFLGNQNPKDPRVANSQKCLRVSGKHNDLEEVGVDTYHHTMFEMLGNWSFGDYFKEDTIAWAWELLTSEYGVDPKDLYITVFGGDEKDGTNKDQEAIDIWKKHVAEERILEFDKKDNFWEMGDQGPCGPSSEIHVDIRPQSEKSKIPGASLVNQDHPQVIEIWNLVFIEFNRKADRSLEKLPKKHVDTGMGLERLAMVLQDKKSNYDTDVFQPIIKTIEKISGKRYREQAENEAEEKVNIALRVIADHLRAISFTIVDGQLPSNTGAGYVIRRILRRAIRYGYQVLGLKEPFLYRLVDGLIDQFKDVFPGISKQSDLLKRVVEEEERSFYKTLEQGLKRLDQVCGRLEGAEKIPGYEVFELYDTYGFPVDLTELIARDKGLQIDKNGFDRALKQQKERSRSATSMETADWVEILEDDHEEFVGYDRLETEVKITRYREVKTKKGAFYQLVFNITPFYPEGGGQVGDSGFIRYGEDNIRIKTTKKENNLIIHFADELPNNLKATFKAEVDSKKRLAAAANHSATHLLHKALRDVLGDHVEQKGSLVHPEYLRFDFSHFSKVTPEELEQIEQQVREGVHQNIKLQEKRNVPVQEALDMGALALFGEKYGDVVRVIQFDSSIELCGGTHVQSTGQIGFFKILSESAVSSGIRRIEAITGQAAENYVNDQLEVLNALHGMLKGPKDIKHSVQKLIDQNSQLNKKVEALNDVLAQSAKKDLMHDLEDKGGIQFAVKRLDLDAGSIKDMLFQIKNEVDNAFVIVGSAQEGKATISVMVAENLVKEKDLHAGKIVKDLAQHIKGGGGGQPFFATAGGKDPNGLDQALEAAKGMV